MLKANNTLLDLLMFVLCSDHFYDTDEGFAGGYNDSSDQQQLRLIQEQEWRAELAKVCSLSLNCVEFTFHEMEQLEKYSTIFAMNFKQCHYTELFIS